MYLWVLSLVSEGGLKLRIFYFTDQPFRRCPRHLGSVLSFFYTLWYFSHLTIHSSYTRYIESKAATQPVGHTHTCTHQSRQLMHKKTDTQENETTLSALDLVEIVHGAG